MQMTPIISVHMTASLIALVIGPIAIWARLGQTKRPWIHRAFGYGWVSMMILSAVTSAFIRDYRLPNIFGYTPIHLLIPFTAFWLVYGFRALAMKEIVKHRRAMIGLYLGACIGAGVFTLLPSRYLGEIIWSQFGLLTSSSP
jgi:uncharacterized membrane protein